MQNVDVDKVYSIEWFNGFITRKYDMQVLKLDELSQSGDVIKAQIVFGRGE